jgi:hypothetical protein
MTRPTNYKEVIKDNESLTIFVTKMSEFQQFFCDQMAAGSDFTIRIEIHGNKGEIIHCRTLLDGFQRPQKSEKRIAQKISQSSTD